MIKRILLLLGLLLSSNAWAENIIVEEVIVKTVADKADNAFMMICTVLVLFMSVPGIVLWWFIALEKYLINAITSFNQFFIDSCIVGNLWLLIGIW